MTLLGYGLMAQKHMQTYLPRMYSGIADPETYFSELDERVMDLVEETTRDLLVGVTLSMDTVEREQQLNSAKAQAEEIVLANEVYLPPERGSRNNELSLG